MTIYFCTCCFCDKKFCINIFCVTKFYTFILACVVSLLSKTNVQILVTRPIVMQINFDANNDVAKIKPQKFFGIYFCNNNFCVKNFCPKNFGVTIFCLFVFATVYSAACIFVYIIKMTIYLNMQKNVAQIVV